MTLISSDLNIIVCLRYLCRSVICKLLSVYLSSRNLWFNLLCKEMLVFRRHGLPLIGSISIKDIAVPCEHTSCSYLSTG